MKILHIYAGNLYGGIETLLVTLAKQRSLSPHMQPYFALCFEGRLASELLATGANVHLLGEVRVSRPWTVWKSRSQLHRLLRQEQFDAVICHACWSQAIFGSAVTSHLPLIFWCHDTLNGSHWLERWAKQTLPDLVITNSSYTLASAMRLYPQSRSEILYSPVLFPKLENPTLIRSRVRTELKTPDDAVVIIQASRLERWKGQTTLLSALAQLRHLPNWICWIVGGAQRVGEAEYLQELETQAHNLGISDRLRFLGQRTDVPRLLAAADIHCQPNTSPEPFGIAFVEALYAGLPVVTTAIGGALEIIDQSCGRLVTPNNINALSEALDSLITNPSERNSLAIRGRSQAEKICDPARQITRLDNLLSQLILRESAA